MRERSVPLLFEESVPGRMGVNLPRLNVPEAELPQELVREDLELPEVGELQVVRHFTRLSQLNFSIDTHFYPLGSCTMKYNPKVHEGVARLTGFADLHPYQAEETCQGALRLMYELEMYLGEIAGLPAVTVQPAAGAHGELTGMLMVRAHHLSRGEEDRRVVLVPDSAHGTNPATATMCGFESRTVPSDERGNLDLAVLKEMLAQERVAGLMLTNPNTLGLFEEQVLEATDLVHRAGGLVYCDGANMNALLGIARPGDLGLDILHFNLHKTFSTPHGGGGPGAGATAVREDLGRFLPIPMVVRDQATGRYALDYDRPQSIGRVRSFYGNFGVVVRAYAYIRTLGAKGLREVSEAAVLNANYLLERLGDTFELPYGRRCLHEFVLSARRQARQGVRTLDIAKRLIDYGFHSPTIYFPLIVPEALMIEPPETESRETLDAFAQALRDIAREAEEQPELVTSAPHDTPVRRLDEATAARRPRLKWEVETP